MGIAKQLTQRACIDGTAFPQTVYTTPMLVQCWASVADVDLTLKNADINAVNMYSIGYCRPTRDRPRMPVSQLNESLTTGLSRPRCEKRHLPLAFEMRPTLSLQSIHLCLHESK